MVESEKNERERITNAVMTAFDKYSQRYLERLIGGMNRASPRWKLVLDEFAKQIGLLLSKRACIPGFYRHVLRRTMANKKLRRQRATLTKAFLVSMLEEEGLKIEELVEKPLRKKPIAKDDGVDGYTRRHVQRIIHDYYPDAFFETKDSLLSSAVDERVKSLTSVFASEELPRTSTSDIAANLASMEKQIWSSSTTAKKMIRSNAELQSIVPEYVQDLISFKEECRQIISQENFLVREKYAKYFCSKDGDFTELFEVFYKQLSSILAQEWFLNQRPATRKMLIDRGYPFEFSSADAAEVRQLLLTLIGFENQVNSILAFCAIALQGRELFDESAILYKEILKSNSLSVGENAIILENIAIVFRKSKKYKLMVGYMKRALKQYELAGENYRVCVALKNIGEAEWNMGFKEKACKFFGKAEERGASLADPMQRFGVLWNLASAFRRIGNVTGERKYLTKCLECLPDNETDTIIQIEARLQQLDKFF